MKSCPRCRSNVDDDALWCVRCGCYFPGDMKLGANIGRSLCLWGLLAAVVAAGVMMWSG